MSKQGARREKKARFCPSFCLVLLGVVAIGVLSMAGALVLYFRNPGSTQQYGVLLIVVAITMLSMGGALMVYFTNPESKPQEALQRTLLEALIMAWTMGVGAIFGLLWGISGR